MLLLQGRHPETNETVVLEEVIAAVEEGVSVQSTRRSVPPERLACRSDPFLDRSAS